MTPLGASGAAERWSTVRSALDSWPRTIRLCMILMAMTAPADVWLIWH